MLAIYKTLEANLGAEFKTRNLAPHMKRAAMELRPYKLYVEYIRIECYCEPEWKHGILKYIELKREYLFYCILCACSEHLIFL